MPMTEQRRIMDDHQPTSERWKPVNGYEGLYEVSDRGRVRSLDRTVTHSDGRVRRLKGKVLSATPKQNGYPFAQLYTQGKSQMRTVHSLVAEAFIGPRPEGLEICHNDGDPTNNHLGNLRYDTHIGNTLDRALHGTDHNAAKTHCPLGHELSAENVPPSVAKLGRRRCLACNRAHSHVRYHPELKPQFKAIADGYYHAIVDKKEVEA